jgi:tetratricopeptide (TPR) repeat protein
MTPLALALAFSLSQGPAAAPDVEALKRTVAVESANVEHSPDDTEALYRLGLAWLTLGEPKKAVAPLEALVKKDAESLDGKLLLARAYRLNRDNDKAKALLDQALLSLPDETSLHAERALLARGTDDTATAVKEYRRAVELSAKDAELVFNLGEAVYTSGKLDDAIALFRQALELDKDLSQARVNLGKALAERGRYSEAKETLAAVTGTTLLDAEGHYNLGVIFMRESNVTQAITEFERTLAINPRHAQAMNNMGVALDARGETKKAAEWFKKATVADPGSAEAYFNLGMSLMRLDKPKEATRAFEQAMKLEPASTSPYVQLGTLYLKEGQKVRAVEAYKKAIELIDQQEKESSGFLQLKKQFNRAKTTEAYRGLALALLSQGKVDEAVATLKTAVEKMPKDPSARQALGEAYLAQGNTDGAIEQLQQRLALEPTTDARLDLARAYVKKRSAKQAEPLYQQVLKEEPDNRVARLGLIDLYLSMGRFAEAELSLKDLISKDGNDATALARLGIMKSRMGRPNEALDPLERAVQENPSLIDARAELGFLLFRGDPAANADRCVSMMNDILVAEPRHTLSLHYRGVCLYGKGLKPRAEESFKAALAIDPNFGAAHYSLGELYENDGKKDEARKEYEAAKALDFGEAAEGLKRLAK